MRVLGLFNKYPDKVIVENYGGVARGFKSFNEYTQYIRDYYGDIVLSHIVKDDLKEYKDAYGKDTYELNIKIENDKDIKYLYYKFMNKIY
jgi:hypothetical protein